MTRSEYLLILIAAVPPAVAGCNDEALPPPGPEHSWTNVSANLDEPQCQPDPWLLDLIESHPWDCDCDALTECPTCTAEDCTASCGVAGLICDPLRGFQCAGTVTVSSLSEAPISTEPSPGGACASGETLVDDECLRCNVGYQLVDGDCLRCPTRFGFDGAECRGTWPIACNVDADCPQGTHCDAARGNICWFDCRVGAATSGCDEGETCDCSGRCAGPSAAEPPPAPVIRTEPSSVVLSAEGADGAVRVRASVIGGGRRPGHHGGRCQSRLRGGVS